MTEEWNIRKNKTQKKRGNAERRRIHRARIANEKFVDLRHLEIVYEEHDEASA